MPGDDSIKRATEEVRGGSLREQGVSRVPGRPPACMRRLPVSEGVPDRRNAAAALTRAITPDAGGNAAEGALTAAG